MKVKFVVKNIHSGVSKKGNSFKIANVFISDCKESPFLIGDCFGIFLNDQFLEDHLVQGATGICDLDLVSNLPQYSNLHYSAECSNFEFLDN